MLSMRMLIILGLLVCQPMWANAEISKVNVKKVEQDLYQTSDGIYIQTDACYAEADRVDAVLKYEKFQCGNNIKFNVNTTCDVLGVFN